MGTQIESIFYIIFYILQYIGCVKKIKNKSKALIWVIIYIKFKTLHSKKSRPAISFLPFALQDIVAFKKLVRVNLYNLDFL